MQLDNIYGEKRVSGTFKNTWKVLRKDKLAMVGLYGVLIIFLLCLVGHWLAPYDPNQAFLDAKLIPPSWARNGNPTFFLGTDYLGRDIMSRLLNGAPITLGSAFLVTLAASLPGIFLGILAGMSRGLRSSILQHILDTLLSIPSLLLAIVIVAFLGPSLQNAMLAAWLASLPHVVRAVYNAVHDELEKEYVVATRLDGATNWIILWQSIMPNISPLLVSESTRVLSIAILDITVLGFLGLGAQSPIIEWGSMLDHRSDLIYTAPWAIMLPGAIIFICILLINLLGDGIRRAILVESR